MRTLTLDEMNTVSGGDMRAQYGGTNSLPYYLLDNGTGTGTGTGSPPAQYSIDGQPYNDICIAEDLGNGTLLSCQGELLQFKGRAQTDLGVTVDVYTSFGSFLNNVSSNAPDLIALGSSGGANNLFGSFGITAPIGPLGIGFDILAVNANGGLNWYVTPHIGLGAGISGVIGIMDVNDPSGWGWTAEGGSGVGASISLYTNGGDAAGKLIPNGNGAYGVYFGAGLSLTYGFTISSDQIADTAKQLGLKFTRGGKL